MIEGLLTIGETLQAAAAQGLDLTERTFRYYGVMGLLPAPLKRPSGQEDARVRYYPGTVIDRLLEIRDLQAQGWSLKQIKTWFERGAEKNRVPDSPPSAPALPPREGLLERGPLPLVAVLVAHLDQMASGGALSAEARSRLGRLAAALDETSARIDALPAVGVLQRPRAALLESIDDMAAVTRALQRGKKHDVDPRAALERASRRFRAAADTLRAWKRLLSV